MTASRNKDLVRAFIAAQTAGDLDAQRRLLHDDVVLHIPPSGTRVVGIATPPRGVDHYIEMRRTALSKIYRDGTRRVTLQHVLGDEDVVAAFYTLTSELVSGGHYENDYVFLYRFQGDKIAEIWEHTDTANAYLQYGFKISKDPAN